MVPQRLQNLRWIATKRVHARVCIRVAQYAVRVFIAGAKYAVFVRRTPSYVIKYVMHS
jgi:hypothetical protein